MHVQHQSLGNISLKIVHNFLFHFFFFVYFEKHEKCFSRLVVKCNDVDMVKFTSIGLHLWLASANNIDYGNYSLLCVGLLNETQFLFFVFFETQFFFKIKGVRRIHLHQ